MSEEIETLGDLRPGTLVGRFRIMRKLAVGGMSIVYEARDEELGRLVALKHPRLDVGDPEINRRRFLREARAASSLLHSNIVPIFEVFEAEGLPWLAMELIEGESLRDRIRNSDPVPLRELLWHAEDLASALSEAHQKGILHRDLKPANVLLDSRGSARLMDFGLSHPISSGDGEDEETITRLTERGFMVGTPGYMSPEQALGRPMDARSDIFCLGLLIYEMCSGRPALSNIDSDGWLDSLLHTPPEPISVVRGDIPEELEGILNRALAKNSEDRYQDMDSMREDLSRLRAEVEAGMARRALLGSRRRRRFLSGMSVGAFVMVIAAASWFGRGILFPPEPKSHWLAEPLTHDPAWAADPALSPDERLIAYVSGRSGSGDIWLIDREGGNPLQLTHHPSADRRPTWSPDGSEVYFTSFRSGEPAIWKIPRFGGRPELMLPDADDPALSPDGRTLTFVRRSESGHYRVAIAPLDELDNFRFLTTSSDGFWYHRNPRFSPDGKMISYNSARNLWIVPVEKGKVRQLTIGPGTVEWARWCGQDLIFSRWFFGTSGLWHIDSKGGKAERLSSGSGNETQVSPSADGRILVYSTQKTRLFLDIVDRSTERIHRLRGVLNPDMAALAPDGSAIVYSAEYRDGWGIFLQYLHQGQSADEAKVMIIMPGTLANPVFSPDGRWIAFHRVLDGQRDIWTLPVEGGKAIRFTTDPGADICPFFSPDGSHLAFSSARSGRIHIWWAPIVEGRRAGDPVQLSFGDTTDYLPRISPDGSMLAWLGNHDQEEDVWIRSLNGDAGDRKLTHGRRAMSAWWEAGSRSLIVSADWEGTSLSARRVSVAEGSSIPLDLPIDFGRGETGGTDFVSGFLSLSADGRFMSYIKTEVMGDLWIMKAETE